MDHYFWFALKSVPLVGNVTFCRLLHHFRTSAGREVDVVLENRRRDLVGVEVKASATVQASDFTGLRELQALTGTRFRDGILLHAGRELLPFGAGLWAVPFQALWAPES